jgi:outer membrane protein assembly factor BamB
LQAELLRALLFPAYLDYRVARVAGQRLIGLSLRTGEVRWRSPLFAKRRAVDGHTAGTAALRDGVGVIVLPVADTVVAFDTETGAIRWTSGANQARGAPLILGDRVIIAGRNGVIEVRQLADGALRCTVRRAVGWDRAGPSVSGDLAIFANLDGEVEAIPTTALLGCSATGASPPSAGR